MNESIERLRSNYQHISHANHTKLNVTHTCGSIGSASDYGSSNHGFETQAGPFGASLKATL